MQRSIAATAIVGEELKEVVAFGDYKKVSVRASDVCEGTLAQSRLLLGVVFAGVHSRHRGRRLLPSRCDMLPSFLRSRGSLQRSVALFLMRII